MPVSTVNAPYATFINTFRCRPEHQDEIIQINIEIIEQVARKHPGFISATVHRSADGMQVINYLQWETAEDLADMQKSAGFRVVADRLAGLVEEFDSHQCDIVHVGAAATSGPA